MYVSDWFDAGLFWSRVPYALIGLTGIVLALALGRRLGRTAALLVAVGCGAFVLSSVLLVPQMAFREWGLEITDLGPRLGVDVAWQFGRVRSTLDLLGTALVVAAVFVPRPGAPARR